MKNSFSLILLSAGTSQRMGTIKANLQWHGISFLERIIANYKSSNINNLIIVSNPLIAIRENYIINNHPEKGRLYSLQLGLQQMESDWYFIQNIDNPFVSTELINQFIHCTKFADIIQPVFNNLKGHPILVSNNIKKEILLETDYSLTLRDVFAKFSKQQIEIEDDAILININTPEQYQKYCDEKIN